MMKKTLIAAGVAVAMAVPMAATADVQLSAQQQVEVFNISGDPRDGNNMNGTGLYMGDAIEAGGNINSGNWSRVDLRASHDLGNGLTALAHIAANTNVTTGNALGGDREINVGLRGDFGTVRFGRLTGAYATAGKDPFNATFMQARGNGGMIGGFGGLGNGAYFDQAIDYRGSFDMLSLAATVAIDSSDEDDSDSTNAEHAYALRANLNLNPVEVWAAYTNADEYGMTGGGQTGAGQDFSAWKLGVEWSDGPIRVMAQYEDITHETAAGDDTDNAGQYIMLAGTYRMGANTFMLGFGQFDAENDADQRWMALGMRHAFTRQVSVHAGVRQTQYNDNDDKETAVGAGMRVVF
ncbi:hypothetical protein B1C78_14070 [Thioalkalivibrio denitrificans]|uniref:Porin domain-containing protein n=1 Tax=Thioalkalivibrio denitrificans TaxID=108003 RepID=A0A1V3NCT6_9GAMM|nr:porin [Thioalkalivibrio denitrificans]OOG22753.1 hypothetical protein B1C78_14070 [Thioalkalivibrio denitrificans]